jgi:hypothetical protein
MSITSWLKKRLTPIKRETTRWAELAEAIEEYFQSYFDPHYDNLIKARSIYTAETSDQLTIIKGLGGYFEDDMPAENLPILVAQRKLELMKKETDAPLRSAIRRLGIPVCWEPLYMVPNGIYGEYFYTDDQLSLEGKTKEECMLTSRGALIIDVSGNPLSNDVAELAIRRCRKLLPLHIVFDRCRLTGIVEGYLPGLVIACCVNEVVTVYPYEDMAILTEGGVAMATEGGVILTTEDSTWI